MQSLVSLTRLSDGLSLPFFSVGRRIHSRTISVTRTWTSRTTAVPDWLLGTRRMPDTIPEGQMAEQTTASPSVHGSGMLPDVESATAPSTIVPSGSVVGQDTAHVRKASDGDAPVEAKEDFADAEPELGTAAMVRPPVDSYDSGLRRRERSTKSSTPTDTPQQVSTLSRRPEHTRV